MVMVAGKRGDAEALWAEVSRVLAPIGLRLAAETTGVRHIDEGFDFPAGASSAALGGVEAASERSTPIRRRKR